MIIGGNQNEWTIGIWKISVDPSLYIAMFFW